MNELQVFNFNGADVRTNRDEKGDPWFVAKDVAEILGYENSRTMTRRLDEDEKGVQKLHTPGGDQEMTVINESGLYSAILGSTKPEAKAFKKWVTGEVLPAIRKSGGYMVSKPDETPEMIMARALKLADETIKRRERELAEAKQEISRKDEALAVAEPKAAFVDAFCVSRGSILVRDFAKHVAQAMGLKGFGERVLFQYLKENDYLNQNRYPSQKSTDMGLFHVSEGTHQFSDGSIGLHHCSRITAKGQTYFFQKLKEKYETCGRWW